MPSNQNDKAIDWKKLSSNPKAIELLLENPDRIVWDEFSKNSNDKAIEILLKNPYNIVWDEFSKNTNIKVVEILKEYQDKL